MYAKRENQNVTPCYSQFRDDQKKWNFQFRNRSWSALIKYVKSDMQISHVLYKTGLLFELTPCSTLLEKQKILQLLT
jgi:hypothetical protein